MSIHVPISPPPPFLTAPDTITATLSRLSREDLAAIVETAIALLDASDGDIDIEDDDPAGDPLDERGEAPTDTGAELLGTLPSYDLDQSTGPTNERHALRRRNVAMLRPTSSEMPYLRRFA